ncbi:ABC transporter permease subunit [Ornithinimicrobium sp. LYQ121]|uniref:ABC transporter permease subunit n=1 Tax=Ornithinimicrobium sp. LYQ121 TaxID=3378801 RepID=UPI0038542BBF
MRLLVVELRRLVARKVVWLTLLGAVAVSLVSVAGIFSQARQIDAARAGGDSDYQRMVEESEFQQEECLRMQDQDRRQSGDASIDYGCADWQVPTIEEFYGQLPSLAEQLGYALQGMAYPVMFLALAMGSTAVAAEFAHRTMGTWLTFVPRRTPVFVSKLLAPALAALPMTLVGLAVVWLGVTLVYRIFELDTALGADGWSSTLWMAVRIAVLAMVAGAFGAAAAFLVRHTGVVLGLMIGYLVLVEGMIGSMFGWVPRYGLARNIGAWVQDGTSWSTYTDCQRMEGCREVTQTLSLTHGAVVIGVVLVVVTVAAWFRFRTADVD